ncbi:SDR family oxidoreductase [uncultured Rikenella sp.]|uniref:SDR family oxidoreductase n=1 Tax=uncultured Rikenella sp. TaxID=368003 RepID=UPI0026326916|nr:SDR family oxidoreductase [uncultured Rikenella sp.]
MDFKNKVVVVTGASSGIGEALARRFAALGAHVVAGARTVDKLEAMVSGLPTEGVAVECDVTREEDCKRLIDRAVERFGGIDVLVNNAGISMRALFDDVDLDVLRRLMDTNFWGAVYCTKYALPYIQRSKGSIVGISSVAGFHGLPGRTGYSASKYAMHGLLETVRIENLKKGVHVLIVAPGFTASNVRFAALTADGSQQGVSPREEGKMMTADEAAVRIIKAIGRRKRTLLMDFDGKGTRILKFFVPGLLDKIYYRHMAKEPDSPFK